MKNINTGTPRNVLGHVISGAIASAVISGAINYKKYQKMKEKDDFFHVPNEFIIHYKNGEKGIGFFVRDINCHEETIPCFIYHLYKTILEFEKMNIPMEKFFTNRIPMFYNLLKIINIIEKGYGRI